VLGSYIKVIFTGTRVQNYAKFLPVRLGGDSAYCLVAWAGSYASRLVPEGTTDF
jgi:hypothetical protein